MKYYKTKSIGLSDENQCAITTLPLSPEESERAYYHLCEGVQEATRKAREGAPSSNGTYLRTMG